MTRPVLIAVVWMFPLAGARGLDESHARLWLLLAQCVGLVGSAFVVNQLHDQSSDRANRKCETLSRGLVSAGEARWLALLLLAGGLAAALALGPWHLAAALLFFGLSALGYNLPPLRAKDRPLLAPLLAAPAYLLLILQGAALHGGTGLALALWDSLPLTLAGVSLSLLATVPDHAGDRMSGKRTWTVAYGEASAWRAALMLMGAAALLAVVGRDWQIGLPAAVSALLMARAAGVGESTGAVRVLRWSVVAQGIGLAYSWPLISIMLLLLMAASRWYYRSRFQLDYPRFGE